ncbi:MAG: MiaB/RimO family radical SAM methylthiotransferase [Planctomycetota bacterium]|jgi:threonylcarbamoyladenosine tRNA methylthiotransferase MtaB
MERFYLKSFGCKVNQYDGQNLRERLVRAGYEETAAPEEADLLVVNFCVVTGRSASRCLRTLKNISRRQPEARLLVSGCLSPGDQARVRDAFPSAALLAKGAPPQGLEDLLIGNDFDEAWGEVHGLQGHTRAFVKVQDGCNLKCSYCILPSIRGEERSRPLADVLEETGRLLEAGYREIVLCGIRLGGYRSENIRLDGLVEILLREHRGSFRMRLSSLNPAEVTPRLLETVAGDSRVARHFHLPLQSGDREVLKGMRRPYSPSQFFKKVEALREVLDEPALSTDLMVGFPGEDEQAFENSLKALEEVRAARVHVFPFSPREGTEAALLPRIPDRIKTDRVQRAQRAAARLKEAFDRSFLGQERKVLVETLKDRATNLPVGLTSRYQKTAVQGLPEGTAAGTFVRVKLDSYRDGVFQGRVKETKAEVLS